MPPKGYWQRIQAGKSHEDALLPPPIIEKKKVIPMSKYEEDKIIDLLKQNISTRKIAKKFKRSRNTIDKIKSKIKTNFIL